MTPKEAILKAVENGSKGVQVVTDVVHMLHVDNPASVASVLKNEDLVTLLGKMVADGEIVEIEYVLPGTNRVKSFYLPKGTDVQVK
jgi:hypothetical protein